VPAERFGDGGRHGRSRPIHHLDLQNRRLPPRVRLGEQMLDATAEKLVHAHVPVRHKEIGELHLIGADRTA
jgi:hypothetical protein